jgi:4-amino-4-deoxy-L-arabinose transferase-like glycosyltransferase
MITVLLLLGAALRGVVLAAYHPALIFPDSVRYLQYAHNFTHGHWTVDDQRQSGYSILLVPFQDELWLVALVQHLAGLATAALVYAVLVRLGAPRWLAALATIPVLFDPLQLVLEQYVLTDIWCVLLLAGALTILVWQREQATWRAAAGCGLLLGLAVAFRDQELIMIVPAAIYLVVATRSWRRLAALAVSFAIPVAAYLGWFDASHGQWGFTTFSGAFLYGRVADFADCTGLALPAYEKPLCPTQPAAQRVADFYTWNPASPQWTFTVPPGKSRDKVVADFSLRILRHQPVAYAQAVGRDLLYGFSPVRGAGPEHYSPAYLKFQTGILPDPQAYTSIAQLGDTPPRVQPQLAAFLHDYGRWFYIPGPLLAAGLITGLAGACFLRRRNGPPSLLFSLATIAVLLPPALFATFDWRYQLPQLTLIPVAAVLGITTLTRPEDQRLYLASYACRDPHTLAFGQAQVLPSAASFTTTVSEGTLCPITFPAPSGVVTSAPTFGASLRKSW